MKTNPKSEIRNPKPAWTLLLVLLLGGVAGAAFYKNTAGQKMWFFARDMATGLPKTGDAANLTAYVSLDFGEANTLTDTSAAEANATTQKGWYVFDVNQHETNGEILLFTAVSATGDVNVCGVQVATFPVDANGLLPVSLHDANSGAMTTAEFVTNVQTAVGDPNEATIAEDLLDLYAQGASILTAVSDPWLKLWQSTDYNDLTFGGLMRFMAGKR